MQRNRQADHARVEEEKADDADERLAFVKIQLGFDRDERLKNFRVDGEVEHGQVTPVRDEKRSHDVVAGIGDPGPLRNHKRQPGSPIPATTLPQQFFQRGIGIGPE